MKSQVEASGVMKACPGVFKEQSFKDLIEDAKKKLSKDELIDVLCECVDVSMKHSELGTETEYKQEVKQNPCRVKKSLPRIPSLSQYENLYNQKKRRLGVSQYFGHNVGVWGGYAVSMRLSNLFLIYGITSMPHNRGESMISVYQDEKVVCRKLRKAGLKIQDLMAENQ